MSTTLNTSSLSDVATRYCDGRASADELARAYYIDSSARNVVAFVCKKYRLEDQVDEVHQVVCTKLVESLVSPTAVYGLIKVLAARKSIDIIRSRVAKPEYSLDAIVERLGESAHFVLDSTSPGLGDVAATLGTAIDSQKAAATFDERLHKNFARYEAVADLYLPAEVQYRDMDPNETPPRTAVLKPFQKAPKAVKREPLATVVPKKIPKPKVKKVKETKANPPDKKELLAVERQHKADAQEIISLRNVLNFTNLEMANALEITEAMFCYTLYSKSHPIKDSLMKKVRSLRENVKAENLETQSNLEGTDATVLITRWMKQLKIDPQSKTANQDFGDFAGASRSTVWRWRNKDLTPKPGKLLEMQKMVNEALKARKVRAA